MTLAAFVVFVVAVLFIATLNAVSLHRTALRERARSDADELRQQALQKQHKAAMHEVLVLKGTIAQMGEKLNALNNDTRLNLQRVDGFFAHSEVKRMLDAGAPGRQPPHVEVSASG